MRTLTGPGPLVITITLRRLVHGNGCGNLAAHTHNNQCSETNVAVLAHSAAELAAVHHYYDLFLMQRNLGYLTWTQPGPENELCELVTTFG